MPEQSEQTSLSDASRELDSAGGTAETAPERDAIEREANKRAGLADRYAYHRDQLVAETRHDPADDAPSASWRDTVPAVGYRIANRLDALDERLSSHRRTVMDIETSPELDDSSPEAAAESERHVRRIRFILSEDDKTEWYSYHPENPDHPLTHLIDYYADGDLSQMYGTEVDIAYSRQGESHIPDGLRDARILYPTPYERRSAHIRYRIMRWAMALDNPDTTEWTETHATKLSSFLPPNINSNTRFNTRFSETFVRRLAGVISLLTVLVGIALMGPVSHVVGESVTGTGTISVPTMLFVLTGALLGLGVFFFLIPRLFREGSEDILEEGLDWTVGAIRWPVRKLRNGIVAFGRWLRDRVVALDTHNPYR